MNEVGEYRPRNKKSFGDIVDERLNEREIKYAEALGSVFYQRSLKVFDMRTLDDNHPLLIDMKYHDKENRKHDPVKMGVDFYKLLGYQMFMKCKETAEQFKDAKPFGGHTTLEMVKIMFDVDLNKDRLIDFEPSNYPAINYHECEDEEF